MSINENKNDDIDILVDALKKQTQIMSDTYILANQNFLKTIKGMHKRESILFMSVFLSFIGFLLVLYIF